MQKNDYLCSHRLRLSAALSIAQASLALRSFIYLTDGSELLVPVGLFPEIKQLRKSHRENYMIMDGQFFSFDAISKIFSVKDVLSSNLA